jgi:hypothetical protein
VNSIQRSARATRGGPGRFLALNAAMWVVMTIILIALPDQLERWMDISIGRAMAWAVAGALWVVVVERQWQSRMGALARFPLQVVLWASSALAAMWISDQFRLSG